MRKTLLLFTTTALALLLAGGVALAATTPFSNTSSISIVDATSAGASPANPYPSEITVQDLSGTISDVNVKLNGYSHPFADDVAVQVVGPDGTSVLLMSDVGGDVGVNSINLTLDDEAANSLFDEGQLTTGTYKPTKGTTPFCPPITPSCLGNDPVPTTWPTPAPALSVSGSQLSGFDSKDPNGTWKLYVIDDGLFSAGTFAGGWSLEIDTGTTPPETAPTVTGAVPTGTNVGRTTDVTATFSEDMKAETITANTFKLFKKGSTTKIAASVSYDPMTRKATLNPFGSTTTRLARGTTYKAVVTTKATDMAGNQLDQDQTPSNGNQQKKWFFTTTP